VTAGNLTGTGTIGTLAIGNGARFSPSGTFNAGTTDLASGSAFVVVAGSQLNSTGAVSLNGLNGSGGAVLQPYAGAGGTIITGASVSGTFNGLPNPSTGITYNATSVVLAGGGNTVAFNPTSYTVEEGAGSVQVTVQWSAGPGTAVLRHFGGGVREGVDVRLVGASTSAAGLTVTYTIPIIDNFLDSGDQTTTLALVPTDGSKITNSATLTIVDNDKEDTKACGFGTGLTVFLLLGFGLLLQLGFRRR
jgi:hypothetical protein